MSSLTITTRQTRSGPRYVVRYRVGGRTYPLQHAGAFKTLKEAKARRDLIGGELAGGRNPADLLRAMRETPKARTFADVYDAFTASRVDVAETTRANYQIHRVRLVALLGDRYPTTITWHDIQTVVGELSKQLSPSSTKNYLGTLRMVLDFADLPANVARDKRVKLPRTEDVIPNPPSASEVEAIIANAPRKWKLALRMLEQTGMRVGELVALEWGDVDHANLRLRIRAGKTNAARRWIPIPEWLMDEIELTCPPDDRTATRRLFHDGSRTAIGNAMRSACQTAGIAFYSPHDLRHRYISVKLREGVPITVIAAHVGHARKSLTLDTYAHVLVDEART